MVSVWAAPNGMDAADIVDQGRSIRPIGSDRFDRIVARERAHAAATGSASGRRSRRTRHDRRRSARHKAARPVSPCPCRRAGRARRGGCRYPSRRFPLRSPRGRCRVVCRHWLRLAARTPDFVCGQQAVGGRVANTQATTSARRLRNLDILHLAILVHVPGLDAVVVVDRVHAADLAQFVLARLDIAGLVDGARLQQQFAAVPVELEIEARQRLVPTGPSIRAVRQLRPPSSETSTRAILPRPDQARPDSTVKPDLWLTGACGLGLVMTDFASIT